jgi:antitoxin (DNA-binding transcriptional repressor) of toxin-antitoxin stability system
MKTIAAWKFKDVCLRTLDEVARTQSVVVITKRGRPVARLVPCPPSPAGRGLAGSVLKEVGDPFGTGDSWDANQAGLARR